MANLILLAAILLAGLSYASLTAADSVGTFGSHRWATSFCSTTHQLCQYPYELACAAAGLVAIWLLMKFVSAIRD